VIRWKRSWPDQTADLPVDVLPASNEEYFPPPPSKRQIAIMDLQNRETERLRRKFGMTRAQFVRSAAGMAVGFWAIDAVMMGQYGSYGFAQVPKPDACDLDWDGKKGAESLKNKPGEFIFDVQSHHVDPDGQWRATNPAIHAFFAAVWPQARQGGDLDPVENLGRFHYLKELYLDSATTCTVLSVVPTSPDADNPLPIAEAAKTIRTVNELARSRRAVMHAFVMPNRGSSGSTNPGPTAPSKPQYLDEELNLMMERASKYKDILRGWKTYCAWGTVPYASGWYLDSDIGMAFLEQVKNVHRNYKQVPAVVATHKGFALPGFDQRAATPRDVAPAAKQNPDIKILVYHSGYDIGDTQKPYRGDEQANSSTNTVDGLIKGLRENNYDASHFKKPGHAFGNVPNVYAELGSVWRDVSHNPDQAAHLLGKLITHVGPRRICWGTDSLWYGSPQSEIVAMRRFEFTEKGKEMYNLPYGLEGDVEDPTKKATRPERTIRNGILGRNAAGAYRINPDERRRKISCDAVNHFRDEGYLANAGTDREVAPLASNEIHGPRTRRELVLAMRDQPWSP
jgi:predicted TIM-barrel fold metal-dependent hydrolase